jgi:hypothetical protein
MESVPTLLEYFARSAEANPDRALFVHSGGALTYGAAASAIARAVEPLRAVAAEIPTDVNSKTTRGSDIVQTRTRLAGIRTAEI